MEGGESRCPNIPILNMTDESKARSILYDATSSGLITIALPVIGTIGCLINASFLFVVVRIPRMRTITNAYLSNLAVADIMFLLTATVASSLEYYSSPVNFDKYPTGIVGCVLFNLIIYTFFFASIFLVTLVSMERYFAICTPLKQWSSSGKTRTAKLLLVTWLFSAGMAALIVPGFIVFKPLCVEWPDKEPFDDFPVMVGKCMPISSWFIPFGRVLRMVLFFIAMIGNVFMYSRIILILKRRFVVGTDDASCRAVNHIQSVRRQVSAMLITTGLVFFLCQVSNQIYALQELIADLTGIMFLSPQQRLIFLWVNRMLLYTNSTVNPIVYNVTNKRYRSAFNMAILHCRGQGDARPTRKRRRCLERADSAQQTIQTTLM